MWRAGVGNQRKGAGAKGRETKGGGAKWVQVTEGREREGAFIYGAGGNETQEQGLKVECFLFAKKIWENRKVELDINTIHSMSKGGAQINRPSEIEYFRRK